MVCGSILVAALALVADLLLAALERYAVSPGISGRSARVARSRAARTPRAAPTQTPVGRPAPPGPRPATSAALVGTSTAGPAAATATTGHPSERDRT